MRNIVAATRALLDPSHPVYATGSEEDREQARRDWHRQRFAAEVAASQLEQLQQADLSAPRYGVIEHLPSGRLFRLRRDELPDLTFSPATAYYLEGETPVLLEPPPGPQTRQGLEAEQAARQERRSQPRPKPAWMR